MLLIKLIYKTMFHVLLVDNFTSKRLIYTYLFCQMLLIKLIYKTMFHVLLRVCVYTVTYICSALNV